MKTMCIKEAAKLWGITERRVSFLCKEGKIKGAQKNKNSWQIPVDTPKPNDGRIKNGFFIKHNNNDKLPLPIGISDYRIASTEYYYVDKTMLIKDFIDERPMVSLFTRPRRFGKTLTMDMIRTFFEMADEDTSIYFKNKKIWACGDKYQQYQGKYPVIYVSFKDIKNSNWNDTFKSLAQVIRMEFLRHKELAHSDKITDHSYYNRIVNQEATQTDYEIAFLKLSQMLHEHYGVAPIIIIDEYDTPIEQGYLKNFYDEVISFMRNLFSGGLKDNRHLSYGFLTGILRVAKESIFSGLNNLTINSILDNKYSEYFGFTPSEVKEMTKYYQIEEKYSEICEWYDGYQFGESEIFNPWSVINYIRNDCKPRAYWQFTGNNEIIGEILEVANETIYEKLNQLLQGKSFLTYIDTNVIYPQMTTNPSSIYSFLLVAGYLKAIKSDSSYAGDYMCEVALPNKEIMFVYNKEILQKLGNIFQPSSTIAIAEAIYKGDTLAFKNHLEMLLMQSVSYFDTVGENFYHGFVLGLCATLDNRYFVSSNKESGNGRYDICLSPKTNNLPGIIIELKSAKDAKDNELKNLAIDALKQIENKNYEIELLSKGINKIFKYGVAFCGKKVEIKSL